MSPLHQLFDPGSSTFTYVLVDPVERMAVIIDPVAEQLQRDLALLRDEGLTLRYVLETHNHADHITSAGSLTRSTSALAAAPIGCGIVAADRQLVDGDRLQFGAEALTAMHTPGHTAGSMSYLWRDCVFTGDCLLIDGCGRTDFQSGDAGALYDSITQRLFGLPDETRVYPAHDYRGRSMSTIGHEKAHNERIAGRSRDEFIALMGSLNLPRPRMMDVAVPANRQLGLDVQAS
ncbi:MAG TPA: MBL fold metallo-hydrolase [Albitalea sp.]|uniref:MBL fold metallo-hydrolase n=1 Tax=Piscinibacter sp. TaxID=1903157 RepID=UPI002ED19CE5